MELCEAYLNKGISINSLKKEDLLYIDVAICNSNGVVKKIVLCKVMKVIQCERTCINTCNAKKYIEAKVIDDPELISELIQIFYCCTRNIVSTSTGHKIIIKDDAACS